MHFILIVLTITYDFHVVSLQTRVTGSQSEDNFDEALRAHHENSSASGDATTPPTEKVPL